MSQNNLLFVAGHPNTATSSLVGMLNSHPEIFITYETWQGPPRMSPYAKGLFEIKPEWRQYFRSDKSIIETYSAILPTSRYQYLGDKIVQLSGAVKEQLFSSDAKIIFVYRDYSEWLVKREIVTYFLPEIDCVSLVFEYFLTLLQAMASKNTLIMKMDFLIGENERAFAQLASFLQLDQSDFDSQWWNSYDGYRDDCKLSQPWWKAHASSRVAPAGVADVKLNRLPHEFWHQADSIFNDIESLTDAPVKPGPVILAQLRTRCISMLQEFSPTGLSHLIKDHAVTPHQPAPSFPPPQARNESVFSRGLRKFKRIVSAVKAELG